VAVDLGSETFEETVEGGHVTTPVTAIHEAEQKENLEGHFEPSSSSMLSNLVAPNGIQPVFGRGHVFASSIR